jgi:hypothetical protein
MNRLPHPGRLLLPAALLLSACATAPAPASFVLTPADIERQIETDLGAALELFKGVAVRRPEVALMPAADRVQLLWVVRMSDGANPVPFGVALALSGKPLLNPAASGIELTDVTIEDVRLSGVPRLFGFGLTQLAEKKGAQLPDLPLVRLPKEQLVRDRVVYAATGVNVTYAGLRVDVRPR